MTKSDPQYLLFEAVLSGNVDMVRAAIAAGADVNARDADRNTPLHLTATYQVAELLVQSGADLNAKNDIGPRRTPLELAKYKGFHRITEMLEAANQQQGHANRVTGERKDKSPPQVGG